MKAVCRCGISLMPEGDKRLANFVSTVCSDLASNEALCCIKQKENEH